MYYEDIVLAVQETRVQPAIQPKMYIYKDPHAALFVNCFQTCYRLYPPHRCACAVYFLGKISLVLLRLITVGHLHQDDTANRSPTPWLQLQHSHFPYPHTSGKTTRVKRPSQESDSNCQHQHQRLGRSLYT